MLKSFCLAGLLLVFTIGTTGLSGCVAIPRIANDERDLSEQYSDAAIITSIKSSLLTEDAGSITGVKVYSFGGVVYLVGEVDQSLRDNAYRIAKETEGVRQVVTHWFKPGTADTVNDAVIDTNINTELLFTKNVSSTQVSVNVYGGNVVLLGIMESQADINRAIRVVKSVPHVKSVTSYLKVYE